MERQWKSWERPSRARSLLVALAIAFVGALGCSDATDPVNPGSPVVVAAVVVTPGAAAVVVGDAIDLRATVRSTRGDSLTGHAVTWTSLDTTIATVSAVGRVLAKQTGQVTIRAEAAGKTGQAVLTVQVPQPMIQALVPAEAAAGGPAMTVTISGSGFRQDARVQWNGTARLTTWVSATELRVSVTAGDLAQVGVAQVQVVNPGIGNGASAASTFRIVAQSNPVKRVELRPALVMTAVGSPAQLTATPLGSQGEPLPGRLVTWTSSNQLVATVDGNGRVTTVGEGEVVITASSEGQDATTVLNAHSGYTYHMLASDGTGLASFDLRLGGPAVRFWQHWAGSRILDPSPSPDGRYIVYTIDGATPQIAILDRASRTYTFLPNGTPGDRPAWSPTGDYIAFRRIGDNRSDIWIVKPDGSGAVNLTADLPAQSSALDPAWSPDGARIAFAVQSNQALQGLMVMNRDGTNKRPLTFGTLDVEPAWHGDGIVFTRRNAAGTASDLWRISVSGIGPFMRLTDSGNAHSPAWSPDGRWIAFVAGPTSNAGAIMAMRPFGEDARPISLPADGPNSGGLTPVWVVQR